MDYGGNSGSNNGGYQQPAPGLKLARIFKIVDVGTQDDEYNGVKKKSRNVLIFWELTQTMADGRPFTTFLEYNQYMGDEKCKLRKHLESWTGKSMTPELIKSFDAQKMLLGKWMMVNLVKKSSQKVKVDGLMAKPPELQRPANGVNPLVYFDLDAKPFDQGAFDGLPAWIQKKIQISPEYRRLQGEVIDDAHDAQNQQANEAPPPIDDDIPF